MAQSRRFARFLMVKATMTVRNLNLVVPLAHKATAMRTTETTGSQPVRSGAVSPLIGQDSYFGLFRQATASHRQCCRLANTIRRRGYSINGDITKTFRRST